MQVESIFHQAEKKRLASHFSEARGLYQNLLNRHPLSPEDKARSLLGLADMERIQGYFPQALRHYEKATSLLKDRRDNSYWDSKVGWALSARACGRPKEALAVLQKALSAYQKERDLPGQAFVHWALGGTWRIAGDMKKGLRELQVALRMFKSLKDPEGVAYTCCALGGLHRMLGRYADSGKYYREANQRMRRRKDTFGTAYSYCGLGNVERMAGRFRQALPFYCKAEKLYGTIGDRVSYAYTLWSIGTTYKMLGQYTQAHWAFHKADNLFKKTGDGRGRIYSLLGFAEIEFLKATSPQSPLPLSRGFEGTQGGGPVNSSGRRARVRGEAWWNKAKAIAAKSNFAWEKLHVESIKDGRVHQLSSRYQKAGSKFFPIALPVNWP